MLDKYFNYRKHKTDFKTEVIAGTSTFLTMAYIMFLNPVILADGGLRFWRCISQLQLWLVPWLVS